MLLLCARALSLIVALGCLTISLPILSQRLELRVKGRNRYRPPSRIAWLLSHALINAEEHGQRYWRDETPRVPRRLPHDRLLVVCTFMLMALVFAPWLLPYNNLDVWLNPQETGSPLMSAFGFMGVAFMLLAAYPLLWPVGCYLSFWLLLFTGRARTDTDDGGGGLETDEDPTPPPDGPPLLRYSRPWPQRLRADGDRDRRRMRGHRVREPHPQRTPQRKPSRV